MEIQEKEIDGIQKELRLPREEENHIEQQMVSSKAHLSQLITSHNDLVTHLTQTKQTVEERQRQHRELSGEGPPGYVSQKTDVDCGMMNDIAATDTMK